MRIEPQTFSSLMSSLLAPAGFLDKVIIATMVMVMELMMFMMVELMMLVMEFVMMEVMVSVMIKLMMINSQIS